MKAKSCILLILFMIGSNVYCQRQDYVWYFGVGTDGLKFDSNGNVTKLTDKYQSGNGTNAFGYEAMVTVTDPMTGSLLFYSDGVTVIDKTHSVMTNGSNLFGDDDNSQGVTCCRVPKTCNKYYIIYNSASDNDTGRLYYSIADFTATANGKVINKNTSFGGTGYHQGMTIVPRRNKNSYWLIVHKYQTASYDVFLIDTAGISSPTNYTFSNAGRSMTMRYNKNAGKILVAGIDNIKMTLIDFNDSSGVLSNEKQIGSSFSNGVYGGNFSPDGSKVYGIVMNGSSNVTELQQYDFSSTSWVNTSNCCYAHDMKMAPDHNMYHIHTYTNTNPLAVIKKPNLSATANAFQYSTITTPGNFNGNVRRFPEFLLVPDYPVIGNDTFTIDASDSLYVSASSLLTNDFDPQTDSIYFYGFSSTPKHGNISIVGNSILYKPNTCGATDSILYKIVDQYCTFDTGYIIIKIDSISNINIIATDSVCEGSNAILKTDYKGVSASTYFWSGPNGFSSNLIQPVINNFSASNDGLYSVYIVLNGCSTNIAQFNIHVKYCVKAGFTFKNKCNGTIDFTNTSANYTKLKWDFGDGKTDNSTVNPTHNYSSVNVYKVVLFVTNASGETDSFKISLSTASDTFNSASFNTSLKNGCAPLYITFKNTSSGGTNYIWDFGDGNKDTNYNTSHTYLVGGIYTVLLASIDSFGCKFYDTASVTIYVQVSPIASFTFNQIKCTDSIVFTNNSNNGINYQWDFGDGATDTNFNTAHMYNKPGTYKVLLTVISGTCKDTELLTVPITIDSSNRASFFADNYGGCIPLNIKFTNKSVGATNYVWDFDDGSVDTNANTTHIFTQAGTYVVKLIALDPSGCSVSDTFRKTIKVITSITADFTYTLNTCTGIVSFADASSQSNKWEWYLVPDTLFSKLQNPDQKFNGDGNYDVQLKAYSGNSCVDSITKTLSLSGINNSLYLPSAFSPNGDGLNDKFEILGNLNCIANFHMDIFNRWGEKIFDTDSLSTLWDGKTYSGKEAPEGIYIYIFKSKDIDLTGNIKLVR